MKALKAIYAFFTEPKFEAIWAVIWLALFISSIVKHTTRTADGWHLSLAGWDLAFALMTAFCFSWSFCTAIHYWSKGRA